MSMRIMHFAHRSIVAFSVVVANLAVVSRVFAQSGAQPGPTNASIVNPISSTSVAQFLEKIIDVLLVFALPIVIFFIMYAGFLFVTARGNESQVTTAKSAFTWAVIGGVIALGAKLIISVIQGTVRAF